MEMYFLTVQCQHCADPECVKVCPTGASHKLEDGTVQIDKSKCIGCQFCAMSCPYGVRYLNEEERVVEKCTLCEQKIAQGELPQCVTQCGGRARYFGDLEQGIAGFEGPAPIDIASRNVDYDATVSDGDSRSYSSMRRTLIPSAKERLAEAASSRSTGRVRPQSRRGACECRNRLRTASERRRHRRCHG